MLEEENGILLHIQYLSALAAIVSVNCSLTIPVLTEPVYEQLSVQYLEAILTAYVGERGCDQS